MSEPITRTQGDYVQGKDIELGTFAEIETDKRNLMMGFSSYSIEDLKPQIKDMFALMESVLMGGYFEDKEVYNYKYPEFDDINATYHYNFFEYFAMVDNTDEKENLRTILMNAYIIYNRFKKRLKISLSTETKSGKKKLSNASFT